MDRTAICEERGELHFTSIHPWQPKHTTSHMADYKLRTYVSDALRSTARGRCLNVASLCLMTAVSGTSRLLRSCDEELMLSWPRTYKHYDRSEYAHRFGLMGKTGSTTISHIPFVGFHMIVSVGPS